jgi:hypothetical protein
MAVPHLLIHSLDGNYFGWFYIELLCLMFLWTFMPIFKTFLSGFFSFFISIYQFYKIMGFVVSSSLIWKNI